MKEWKFIVICGFLGIIAAVFAGLLIIEVVAYKQLKRIDQTFGKAIASQKQLWDAHGRIDRLDKRLRKGGL